MNPPGSKRLPASPDEWLMHALSDPRLGKLGQKNKGVLRQQICFHTQQAAEKAFKAVLLYRKVDFPLTHDIQELMDIFDKAGILLPSDFQNAGILTPYAVETRYPGYWDEIAKKEVSEAVKLASKIVTWSKKYITRRR
jgi:HEPN domain-containing protein